MRDRIFGDFSMKTVGIKAKGVTEQIKDAELRDRSWKINFRLSGECLYCR
jgi:hypothetical protein